MSTIIAELSCNHGGEKRAAMQLVREAKLCGADGVKFQYYRPEDLTMECDEGPFVMQSGPWKGRDLWSLYQETHTPKEWFPELFEYARNLGLTVACSVYTPEDAEVVSRMGVRILKIASAEARWLELLDACVMHGTTVLVSDGAGELPTPLPGCVTPMVCVAEYPAPQNAFGFRDLPYRSWGLSDHSMSRFVWMTAAALGAEFIEAHLKLAGGPRTPDSSFSLTGHEFAQLAHEARTVADIAGRRRAPSRGLEFERRWVARRMIKEGATIRREDVAAVRCSAGITVDKNILGCTADRAIYRCEPITMEVLL